ncbi:MAG: hypothetical protein WD469_12865 [Paenibacillaceae bacterium]
MSKKRREKVKAKQRRHNEKPEPKTITTSTASLNKISDTSGNTATSAPNPLISQNKSLQQAAPAWKALYNGMSNSVSQS